MLNKPYSESKTYTKTTSTVRSGRQPTRPAIFPIKDTVGHCLYKRMLVTKEIAAAIKNKKQPAYPQPPSNRSPLELSVMAVKLSAREKVERIIYVYIKYRVKIEN